MTSYFWPFLSNLYIKDKHLNVLRLGDHATWVQRQIIAKTEALMNDEKPVRIIILKARQMGCSTIIEGMLFQCAFALPGMSGMVIAHDNDSSAHLLGMTKHYWETWGHRELFTTKHEATNKLAWKENRSLLTISTAKNAKAGRSRTLQFVHCSEAGFYDDPETLITGLNQAIPRAPRTFQFIESTANGIGNWYNRTWEGAKSGDNDYTPLFFAWWQHPTYTANHIGMADLVSQPIPRCLPDMNDEERIIYRALRRLGMDDSEVKARLIWRRVIFRNECRGDIQTLHQEYPTTDEEAFISTGTNVFNLDLLRKVYEPEDGERGRLVREGSVVRFVRDETGPLRVYRHPRPDGWYMVGGDASKAATKGDYACGQILDRRTWEQVACFRERLAPAEFAREMLKLGEWYNHGMLAPENNMSGAGVAEIVRTTYNNVFMHQKANRVPGQIDQMFGWVTNMQTKAEAIGNLQAAIIDAAQPAAQATGTGIRIHDAATFGELKGYVTNPQGGYEASGNDNAEHDDTVMALAIALTCTKYEAAMMYANGTVPPTGPISPERAGLQTPDRAAFVDAAGEHEAVSAPTTIESHGRLMMPAARQEQFVSGDEGSWDDWDQGRT